MTGLWFKHILFRRKGLGAAYNTTMPIPEEVFTKEPNHTHAHTCTLKNRMFDNNKQRDGTLQDFLNCDDSLLTIGISDKDVIYSQRL